MPIAPARWSHSLPLPSSVPTAPFRPLPRELPPDLEADRLACLLKTTLQRISAPLARASAVLIAQETWNDFGYARLEDHARERYGRTGRWVRDLAALGRGLDGLPGLEGALSGVDGKPAIGFVPALHIARIASPESVPAWLGLARSMSARCLKDRIRLARQAGSSWPVEAAGGEQPEKRDGTPPGNAPSRQGDVNAPPGDQAPGPDNGNAPPGDVDIFAGGEGPGRDNGNASRIAGDSSATAANVTPDHGDGSRRHDHDSPESAISGAQEGHSGASGAASGPRAEDARSIGGRSGPRGSRLDTGDQAAGSRGKDSHAIGQATGPQAGHLDTDDQVAGEWLRVRLLVPRPVRIAFEEGLDLCRAVEGRDVPVSVYVDALVAEASTGALPADADCLPVLRGRTQADMEEALELATANWRELGNAPSPDHEIEHKDPEMARMSALLQRFLQGSLQGGASPANVLHGVVEGSDEDSRDIPGGNGSPTNVLHAGIENPDAVIRQLLELQDRCERQLGRLLARMSDQGAWRRLRFAGLGHYAEQRLGLARTSARERARLARGLRALPVIRRAYDDGRLGSVAALCLVRMLEDDPPDEAIQRDWIERAARGTVKRLRDECRELDRRWANERSPRSCRQVSERSPCVSRPLTDAEWHRSLHREPGTARARVARLGRDVTVLSFANTIFSVSLPEDLATAFLSAIEAARHGLQDRVRVVGEVFEKPGDQASTLYPDRLIPFGEGERNGRAPTLCANRPTPVGAGESGEEDTGENRSSEDRPGHDEHRASEPHRSEIDARPSLNIARKLVAHGHEVPAWVGLLALIEEFVATWDVAQNPRRPSEDAVHIRDGWRCMAPGCTSRRNLQEHHVRYRSQGGGDEMDNRLCLCAFHHQRGEHGELASCRGRAPLGIEWSLGRGGRGGLFRNEMRLAGMTGCVPGRIMPLLFDRL